MSGAGHTEAKSTLCRGCKREYAATPHDLAKRDYKCKPCRAEENREYREKRKALGFRVSGSQMSREYYLARDARNRARPEVRQRKNELARMRRLDPVQRFKIDCRRKTRDAILSGRLTRQPCEVCGAAKVQAHHDDYAKPLDVRWLCLTHHREHHALARGTAS